MNIITIVGARPQFIKAAVVSAAVRKAAAAGADISEKILHTGQHYDYNMSELMFRELHLPAPVWNLGCTSSVEEMQQAVTAVLQEQTPDMVVVYGDTNSTLAGALAAHALHIPVAHVEAGLRSYNDKMAEEFNRIQTDRISSLLFCPTSTAVSNLKQENITQGVYRTGDVMYDAALQFTPVAERQSDILQRLNLIPGQFALATIHRAETADLVDKLQNIIRALSRLPYKVVLPLHPRTAHTVAQSAETASLIRRSTNILLIEPVGYLEMLVLEKNASLILTDSGGVQKEAYFQHTPCVTLRGETEWTETVAAGWNIIAGTDTENIISAALSARCGKPIDEYGNGHSAEMIADIISTLS